MSRYCPLSVPLMNCASLGLNLLTQSSKGASFVLLCPICDQHTQLESETLPNVFCRPSAKTLWRWFVTVSTLHTIWCPSSHFVISQSSGCYWCWIQPPCLLCLLQKIVRTLTCSSITACFKIVNCSHK